MEVNHDCILLEKESLLKINHSSSLYLTNIPKLDSSRNNIKGLLPVLVTNYLARVAQIFGYLWGYLEKHHFLSKTCCCNFGLFLFQHLVTMALGKYCP